MSPLEATLQRALAGACERSGAPGAVLGLALHGRRTIVAAGRADAVSQRAMTPYTLCRLGSVSKVLTALLAMRAVEARVLDLDAPLQRRWPRFRLATRQAGASVTLGQLLSHTAGVYGDFLESTGDDDDALDLYARGADQFDLTSPPGAAFSYANAGFSLAARACEVAYREHPSSLLSRPWDALLDAELLAPLAMRRTLSRWQNLPDDRACGHEFNAYGGVRRLPHGVANRALAPAGQAIWTDAGDLLALGQAVLSAYQGQTIAGLPSPNLLKAMTRSVVKSPVPSFARAWGLGFARFDQGGPEQFGHDGAVDGQFAFWRLFPAADLVVCLFVNGGDARGVFADVFEAIEGALAVNLGVDRTAWPAATQGGDLARYAGRYGVSRYAVDVIPRGDELLARYGAVANAMGDIDTAIEVTLQPAAGEQDGLFLSLWPHTRLPTHQAFLWEPGRSGGEPEALVFRGRRLPRLAADTQRGELWRTS